MKYKLTAEKTFSSAHALREYKGKCENMHGHNWRVKVVVAGNKLNNIGLLIDFGHIKGLLHKVIEDLDHKNLNEVKPFDKTNPSAENIADYVFKKMKEYINKKFKNVYMLEATVWESDSSSATVTDEQ